MAVIYKFIRDGKRCSLVCSSLEEAFSQAADDYLNGRAKALEINDGRWSYNGKRLYRFLSRHSIKLVNK